MKRGKLVFVIPIFFASLVFIPLVSDKCEFLLTLLLNRLEFDHRLHLFTTHWKNRSREE